MEHGGKFDSKCSKNIKVVQAASLHCQRQFACNATIATTNYSK
jgi:hypothetical protein